MSESKIYPVPAALRERAFINKEKYETMYKASIEQPDAFWTEQANTFLTWDKPWNKISESDLAKGEARWFIDGKLNVTVNCIDRHLASRADQTAIIWEGDDTKESAHITYRQLHEHVCRFANVLKSRGVKKGDRVCIYMPMIPEAAYAMLACARIGAIHSVVFGGFSPESLKDRILDADCRVVITADEGIRGGKLIPLKKNTDAAVNQCPNINTVIVIKRTGNNIEWNAQKDVWYHELAATVSTDCAPELMDSEDPLFILYTSGSTGKPKGVLHTIAGYLLMAAITHKYAFDYNDG
jgi:acetyl-CoA synthetase